MDSVPSIPKMVKNISSWGFNGNAQFFIQMVMEMMPIAGHMTGHPFPRLIVVTASKLPRQRRRWPLPRRCSFRTPKACEGDKLASQCLAGGDDRDAKSDHKRGLRGKMGFLSVLVPFWVRTR